MTSRERMITAFCNRQPDMVPVSPDMSNMIPCRLTGKPFWDIYLHHDPPLWKAYIEAVRYFDFDGWLPCGFHVPNLNVEGETKTISQTDDRIVTRTILHTPNGHLWQETTYYRADPPTPTVKPVKRIPEDLEMWIDYFYPDPSLAGDEGYRAIKDEMGDLGVVGPSVGLPGLQDLFNIVEGGMEAVTYAYIDYPGLMDKYAEVQERYWVKLAERILDVRPDFLMIGVSGVMTLQSPEIFRRLSLPTLQKVTAMAKEAGIPSHLHACGREKALVEICANETDLSSIEPLERPPMGDCDLGEIKRKFGKRLALKGNLHTTDVMLRGTAEDVRRESKRCIDDAAEGGGFVLSTGDQCGRDTPDENIFAMIETAQEYGVY
jgi:uroporphyrinogen decarboxylase